MIIKRYDLVIDGKEVGFFKPAYALGLISEKSYQYINEHLTVPVVKSLNPVKCYFTGKGVSKFCHIIYEIINNANSYRLLKLAVTETIINTDDKDSKNLLYKDDCQVVLVEKE